MDSQGIRHVDVPVADGVGDDCVRLRIGGGRSGGTRSRQSSMTGASPLQCSGACNILLKTMTTPFGHPGSSRSKALRGHRPKCQHLSFAGG